MACGTTSIFTFFVFDPNPQMTSPSAWMVILSRTSVELVNLIVAAKERIMIVRMEQTITVFAEFLDIFTLIVHPLFVP